jgi:hypothetical protein
LGWYWLQLGQLSGACSSFAITPLKLEQDWSTLLSIPVTEFLLHSSLQSPKGIRGLEHWRLSGSEAEISPVTGIGAKVERTGGESEEVLGLIQNLAGGLERLAVADPFHDRG